MGKEFEYDYIKSPVSQNELNLLIDELREQINLTEFPVVPRTDDEFLAKFIRTKKYNINSAFDAVRKYYATIVRNSNLIKGLRPTDCKNGFFSKAFTFLPERHNGARIVTASGRHWNPKEHSVRELRLAGAFIFEEDIKEVETQENGFMVIIDLSGMRWEHIRQFTPKLIKELLLCAQDGLPIRVSAVHLVNPPTMFWPIYSIVIKLVKEKIRKRVHFHYDLETLHDFVPKEKLPMSYGGLIPDDEADDIEFYERIVQKNNPYDRYWNGAQPSKRLSRIHLTVPDILVAAS